MYATRHEHCLVSHYTVLCLSLSCMDMWTCVATPNQYHENRRRVWLFRDSVLRDITVSQSPSKSVIGLVKERTLFDCGVVDSNTHVGIYLIWYSNTLVYSDGIHCDETCTLKKIVQPVRVKSTLNPMLKGVDDNDTSVYLAIRDWPGYTRT